MAKKSGQGKFKPYDSPSHVHDHPVHQLTDPSGGMHVGTQLPGMPVPAGGFMGQPNDNEGI